MRDADNIASRFFGGLGKALASFIDQLADFLAPAPPPTRDQAERMAKAAEEKQEERAQRDAQAERDAAQHWLIEEARRRAAEREAGLSPESPRPRDDRDRGYERER